MYHASGEGKVSMQEIKWFVRSHYNRHKNSPDFSGG